MFEVKVADFFSAAHSLRNYKGKCEAVHGHNWKVEVVVRKESLGIDGLTIDFHDLKEMLNSVLDKLDHKDLNQIDSFRKDNPSSEIIARFIYKKLLPQVKQKGGFLKRVEVWEQRDSSAVYYED